MTDLFNAALMTANGFGKTGVLDKYGNIFGIVLLAFGLIMLLFSIKVFKMGSFYLEMENHDPIIKDNGYEPGEAEIIDRRTSKVGEMEFTEMLVRFTHGEECFDKWTPDLGIDGTVKIEYDPAHPDQFYISDKVNESDAEPGDPNGDGDEEELKDPPNKAAIAMLVFGIALIALGCGFLYDFYI